MKGANKHWNKCEITKMPQSVILGWSSLLTAWSSWLLLSHPGKSGKTLAPLLPKHSNYHKHGWHGADSFTQAEEGTLMECCRYLPVWDEAPVSVWCLMEVLRLTCCCSFSPDMHRCLGPQITANLWLYSFINEPGSGGGWGAGGVAAYTRLSHTSRCICLN